MAEKIPQMKARALLAIVERLTCRCCEYSDDGVNCDMLPDDGLRSPCLPCQARKLLEGE